MDVFPNAAGAAGFNAHLQVQVTNAGGGVIRNQRGFGLYKWGNPVAAPQFASIDDHPTRPNVVPLQIAKNQLADTDELRILFVRDGSIGTWLGSICVDFAVDITNESPVLEIPTSLVGVGGTAVPYNPVYNPQTY